MPDMELVNNCIAMHCLINGVAHPYLVLFIVIT